VKASDLLIEASGAWCTHWSSAPGSSRTCRSPAAPRHARRAHHVRREVRPLGAPGRSDRQRLIAARARVAVGKLSGAVGPTRTSIRRRRVRVRGARALAHPATQSSPGTATPSTCTPVPRSAPHRAHRHRDPPSGKERGGRGRGAFAPARRAARRCRTSATRSSPSASPAGRVLRGYLGAGLEDVALWHERDISHSSVERVVLPDASLLTLYMLRKATASWPASSSMRACPGQPDRGLLRARLQPSVLLALVGSGLSRDEAYRIVQRDARVSWSERRPLRAVLAEDDDVHLSGEELDRASTSSATSRTSRASPTRSRHRGDVGAPGEHHRAAGVGPPGKVRDLYASAASSSSWWPRTGSRRST